MFRIYEKSSYGLTEIESNSIHAAIMDPPYGINLEEWDTLPDNQIWADCLRVLKPGGFLKLCENKHNLIKFQNLTYDFKDKTFPTFQEDHDTKQTNDDDFKKKIPKGKEEESKNEEKKEVVGDKLTRIVLGQKILGFWELDSNLADLLFLNEEHVLKSCPLEFQDKIQVWVTMIVMIYLRANFSEKMGSLTLILEKSEEWLKENGVKFLEYQDRIEVILEKK